MAMSAATKLGPKGDMRLMENRNGLAVGVLVTEATGRAERQAAVDLLSRLRGVGRITLGGDKNYDTGGFVAKCREMKVTPHGAQNTKGRASDIDGRTTRHPGYAISQRVRKRVEEIFGWTKTVDGGRKLRYIGVARNHVGGPDGGGLQPGPDDQIGSKPGLKVLKRPQPVAAYPSKKPELTVFSPPVGFISAPC